MMEMTCLKTIIGYDPKINILGCRAKPPISSKAYRRSNFQVAQLPFLIANLESA